VRQRNSNLIRHQAGGNLVHGSPRIIELLNGLISLDLRAINQYFLHAKMCENWGYERMAKRLRDQAFAEMKDAEELVDRVLYFDGLPNLQRFDAFAVGETVVEQLELALELEKEAVEQITALMKACEEEGDTATREFLAPKLLDEQTHISWIESQLTLVRQVGEANYLAQQVRE
jgi:bacterioferritin